jgi:hypothetical protein
MPPKGRRISASQVGQYVYCSHAWWLAEVEKCQPVDLDAIRSGTRAHERHGWQVSLARGFHKLALLVLASAVIALLAWGVAWLVG